MTSIDEMTADELIRKVKGLRNLGRFRTSAKGPTGVGDTLEGLLGLPRTNISLPDWGSIEVKAHRKGSGSKISLISLKPIILGDGERSTIIKEYGQESSTSGRINLYITISAKCENKNGWKLNIDSKKGYILIQCRGKSIAETNLNELYEKLEQKAKNLIIVYAKSFKESNTEFFEYRAATLYKDLRAERIPRLLTMGTMVFEWRMHLKSNGTVRDHGPAYRISPKDMHRLYAHVEKMF